MVRPIPGSMAKLDRAFYLRSDVVRIARDLLGKVLVTRIDGVRTAGVITETEAYAGTTDKASHAFGDRRTARTEVMYAEGGVAYIYLCYGIHHLFNVVTNVKGIPHAVLIRGMHPIEGMSRMRTRRNGMSTTKGPGTAAQALGINTSLSGSDLCGDRIWIEDRGIVPKAGSVQVGPRVGVNYAGSDAALPYRFLYSYSNDQ